MAGRKSALVIVDVQNDFIDGSLSVRNGAARMEPLGVIDRINDLANNCRFQIVVATRDYHPKDHVSFYPNLTKRPVKYASKPLADIQQFETVTFDIRGGYTQTLWPPHCVQGTKGAELHDRLRLPPGTVEVLKGAHPDFDSYSAFDPCDNRLSRILADNNITDVYCCGFCHDICVGETTVDALRLGYRTFIVEDCCAAFDLTDVEKMSGRIRNAGGFIVKLADVKMRLNDSSDPGLSS